MSIGKRLIDLARSELNSLLDKAAEVDDTRDDRWGGDLGGLSDDELEAELQRRRHAREEADEAARGPRPESARAGANARPGASSDAGAGSGPGARSGSRSAPPRRTASGDEAIRRAYSALEIPPGSDFETVRKAYRRLMRKYHPDLHGGSVEAQRAATDLTQRLTESYKLIEKQTRR